MGEGAIPVEEYNQRKSDESKVSRRSFLGGALFGAIAAAGAILGGKQAIEATKSGLKMAGKEMERLEKIDSQATTTEAGEAAKEYQLRKAKESSPSK